MGGGGGRGRGGLKRGVGEGNLKHMKRRSVSFEEDLPGGGGGGGGGVMGRETGGDVSSDMEERRRERRRSEAKAAIEVGCLFIFDSARCLMDFFFLFLKLIARQRHQWSWTDRQ
jgi:hypothetical protein